MLEADASSHTGCVVYSTAVCDCVAERFCDAHAYLVAYSRIQTNRKHPKWFSIDYCIIILSVASNYIRYINLL